MSTNRENYKQLDLLPNTVCYKGNMSSVILKEPSHKDGTESTLYS